ncbi:MAG TPA: BTAD domain-containing putative transcriptional regulator [Acidimicrobiales bacterium]|jgi:DNA-binding SARP family transcriptional activator|nr:BTAD domain-containing putative transcriptional regulator [Acidimicrobiales bacterium]
MRRIDRPRLVNRLRDRHQLRLTVLEAPPGFGITTVIDQALAEPPSGPDHIDVRIAGDRSLSPPGALAAAILQGLSAPSRTGAAAAGAAVRGPAVGADAVVAAVEARAGPMAIVIDDFELTAPGGTDLCAALLESGSQKMHLVLAGRPTTGIGVSRWVAAGTAVQIGADDLAFRPDEAAAVFRASDRPLPADREVVGWPALASLLIADRPDLLVPYLQDRVMPYLSSDVIAGLAVLAVAGGCQLEGVGPVLATVSTEGDVALDTQKVLAALASVPLVEIDAQGCWPHPLWLDATVGLLTAEARRRVLIARLDADPSDATVRDVAAAAIRWRDGPALEHVVRTALAAEPVRIGVAELRAWFDTGLIGDGPERAWLEGILSLRAGGATVHAMDRLEVARARFEAAGDGAAETAVLLQLGMVARGRDDLTSLARLLERASELAQGGQPAAAALVALGRAVRAQMGGDPAGALRAVQEVPVGALSGDWATQVLMVCGTNLALAGRTAEAVAVLEVANGTGTSSARAVASDLLSAARWSGGDRAAAIEAARTGLRLAEAGGSASGMTMARTALACMLASVGRLEEAESLLDRVAATVPSGEAAALAEVGRVLLAVASRDLEAARQRLGTLGPPVTRPTRSSLWRAALEVGLMSDPTHEWAELAERSLPFRLAVGAGRAWAAALDAGQLLDGRWRPYVPDVWCQTTDNPIRLRVLGRSEIELWSGEAPSRAWARPRVRELALHLALCEDVSRETVAARLWPDLGTRAAGTNLRVTLSHLLDVLEPERSRGTGSHLVRQEHGQLGFDRRGALRVDLWDAVDNARVVIGAGPDEGAALVAAARRMVQAGSGAFLGGGPCGDWAEPYRRRFESDVIHAALRAGPVAVEAGDFGLAEALADSILDLDAWSEDGHRLLLSARLAAGDTDGARRALVRAEAAFEEIGVSPSDRFRSVARRIRYGAHSRPAHDLA